MEDSDLRFEDLQILTDAQINEVFPLTSGRKVEGEYYMPYFEQHNKKLATRTRDAEDHCRRMSNYICLSSRSFMAMAWLAHAPAQMPDGKAGSV